MASKDEDEHLKAVAYDGRRGKAKTPEDDAIELSEMDGDYASLRPSNKPIPRLHVMDRTGKVRTYMYHHLDSDARFDGNSFVVVFAATKLWEITVKGRNLWRIFDYVTLARWPYLREDHRSGFKDGEVIESITIKDITPKDRPSPVPMAGESAEPLRERVP